MEAQIKLVLVGAGLLHIFQNLQHDLAREVGLLEAGELDESAPGRSSRGH